MTNMTLLNASTRILLCAFLVQQCAAFNLKSYLLGEESDVDGDGPSLSNTSTKRKAKLPRIVSRDLETSVAAADWPTTPLSPLCEGWAFLDAGPGDNTGGDRKSSGQGASSSSSSSGTYHEQWKWGYLDTLVSGNATESLPSTSPSGAADLSYGDATELAVRSAALGRPDATGSTSALAEDAAELFDDSFQGRILRYNLALRTYSPMCELHRTLARDAAIGSGIYKPSDSAHSAKSLPNVFAVVHPSGIVGTGANDVVEAFRDAQAQAKISAADAYDGESPLLPGERPRFQYSESAATVIILYGQFGDADFAEFYSALSSKNVPFVVRNMGAIDFEESGENTGRTGLSAEKTTLQGYGVRLDIRNLEYKVFDDKADANDEDELGEEENEAERILAASLRPEFLAGFNLTRLADRVSLAMEHNSTHHLLSSVQSKLIESDHAQSFKSQTVPPQWQRRDLPLQAAYVVSRASDPLWALQDISQNLPSHASTLVEVDVPDEVRIAAEIASEMPLVVSSRGDQGPFALFVNGRRIAVQRPSFNLFELMDILREEDSLLAELEESLGQHIGLSGLTTVQKMIEMGETAIDKLGSKDGSMEKVSEDAMNMDVFRDEDAVEEEGGADGAASKFRIDVGRGYRGAVAYINDIERDPQYRQWPRSIQQMLMMSQFGQPPTVRRNMFTMLIVMDPLSGEQRLTMDMAIHFIQSNFPLRLGFLFVSDVDIDTCRSSGGDGCTFPPLNVGDAVDLTDLKGIKATTQTASLLVDGLIKEYGGMAALGFVDMLASTWKGQSSLNDLVQVYVDFLRRSSIASEGEAVEKALAALAKDKTRDESEKNSADVNYATSVEFALSKSIRPGMSFLNGLPLPDSPQEMQKIFLEEQEHIMQLAASGAITDSKPKSVYGMLLTGDNVHARHHPLLMESKGRYLNIDHGAGAQSLRFPESHDQESIKAIEAGGTVAAAPFVVEAFLDLDSKNGQKMALDFITAMEALPQTLGNPKTGDLTSVVYRVVPRGSMRSRRSGASVAKLLTQASRFDASTLISFLKAYVEKDDGDGIESVIAGLSDVSEENRIALSEAAASGDELDWAVVEGLPTTNFFLANGRVFVPDGDSISVGDIVILLAIGLSRSRAIVRLMGDELNGNERLHDTAAKASAFVCSHLSSSSNHIKRVDVSSLQDHDERTRALYFTWNSPEKDRSDSSAGRHLQVKITAVLDPLSEATQRVSPLLRAIRDQLKLPLALMLSPRPVIGGDDLPVSSYYRFVAEAISPASPERAAPKASFQNLPTNHVLTIRMDVPEPWNVQQNFAIQDTDNLRCDIKSGCSDEAYSAALGHKMPDGSKYNAQGDNRVGLTAIEYGLRSLLFFGQCYDVSEGSPPNGLQLTIDQTTQTDLRLLSPGTGGVSEMEIQPDGTTTDAGAASSSFIPTNVYHTDTLVMKTVGYWQLRAKPGVFKLSIASDSRGSKIYKMVEGTVTNGQVKVNKDASATSSRNIVMKDFVSTSQILLVKRREGYENAELYSENDDDEGGDDDTVHVFSLATGHLYERFLKIMMLSVTKRTSTKVKFWLFENFLSPPFKATATAMAKHIGCDINFVTYKWPEWLRGQSEKQRIIWGYKILFLDVLFPLDVKKIIYVDADQVVRGDMKELVDLDLQGAPYGYTPMCNSREETRGYAFWNTGFWSSHLRDKPYHISALYVVDLARFRREMVGDKLRSYYQSLTADPQSLANLDQDLPNYAQHDVPIFSLPQEWLWCESWCSDETKATAKTIDLCNNPMHKEPKVSMAKRIISGNLFEESWVELDQEVQAFEDEYFAAM